MSRSRRQVTRARHLLKKARERAKYQMLPCRLTEADIEAVWPPDNRCPVLGLPLVRGTGFLHDASPTLDRVNPEWGYEPGNIAVISYRANRAKGGCSAHELERIAAWMRSRGME